MQKHTAIAIAQASLILVVLLWFVSVMIDCGNFLSRECDGAIWSSWLDLWRLGWVKNYKELIAGALTAAAAALIVVATRMQVNAAAKIAEDNRIEAIKSAFVVAADCFGTAATVLRNRSITAEDCQLFDDLRYPNSFIVAHGDLHRMCRLSALNTKRALQMLHKMAAGNQIPKEIDNVPMLIREQTVNSLAVAIVLKRLMIYAGQTKPPYDTLVPSQILMKTIKDMRVNVDALKSAGRYFDKSTIDAEQIPLRPN